MNTQRQIHYWAHMLDEAFNEEQFLCEDKHAFKQKFGNERDFDKLFDKYWNVIRHRCKQPENAIEHWQNRSFAEFREFVQKFDAQNKSTRKDAEYKQQAEKAGAKLLEPDIDGYEVWFVPSYDAAKVLGRFYKGKSTAWCISTDNQSYFKKYYDERNIDFLFLIKAEPVGNDLDKVALEIRPSGDVIPWNVADKHLLPNNVKAVADKAIDIYRELNVPQARHVKTSKHLGPRIDEYVEQMNGVLEDAAQHGIKYMTYIVSEHLPEEVMHWMEEKAKSKGMSKSFQEDLHDLVEELADDDDINTFGETLNVDEGFSGGENGNIIYANCIDGSGYGYE